MEKNLYIAQYDGNVKKTVLRKAKKGGGAHFYTTAKTDIVGKTKAHKALFKLEQIDPTAFAMVTDSGHVSVFHENDSSNEDVPQLKRVFNLANNKDDVLGAAFHVDGEDLYCAISTTVNSRCDIDIVKIVFEEGVFRKYTISKIDYDVRNGVEYKDLFFGHRGTYLIAASDMSFLVKFDYVSLDNVTMWNSVHQLMKKKEVTIQEYEKRIMKLEKKFIAKAMKIKTKIHVDFEKRHKLKLDKSMIL